MPDSYYNFSETPAASGSLAVSNTAAESKPRVRNGVGLFFRPYLWPRLASKAVLANQASNRSHPALSLTRAATTPPFGMRSYRSPVTHNAAVLVRTVARAS